jgi:type I restriction enzyme M protein
MNLAEQQFLNDLDKRLWTMANKLLPMLDAAVYKHVVLGLIFLKYRQPDLGASLVFKAF